MYTEIEQKLITEAESWRKSGEFVKDVWSDNTPFIEYNGLRVRATKYEGKWFFKAIARRGFTGADCKTLQESIDICLEDKKIHDEKFRIKILNRNNENTK